MSTEDIEASPNKVYKDTLKYKVKEKALKDLNEMKNKHVKVKMIDHETLEMAEYLKSEVMTNTEAKFLFAIRTKMLDVKSNFSHYYGNDLSCALCDNEDTQEHLLECHMLEKHELVDEFPNYINIYSHNVDMQIKMCLLLKSKWEMRRKLESMLNEI